jgi:hypothetical protein
MISTNDDRDWKKISAISAQPVPYSDLEESIKMNLK